MRIISIEILYSTLLYLFILYYIPYCLLYLVLLLIPLSAPRPPLLYNNNEDSSLLLSLLSPLQVDSDDQHEDEPSPIGDES